MFVRHGSISIDGARKVTQNGRVAWAASTSGGTNATGGRDDFEEVSVQERERDQERERERNERERERERERETRERKGLVLFSMPSSYSLLRVRSAFLMI